MADKDFKVKTGLDLPAPLPASKGGTGQTTLANALNALLPSQTNNTSKILGSDGTNTVWVNPGASYQTSAPNNPVTGQLWVDSDETGDSLDPYIIRRKTITATAGQTVFTTDVVFTDGYEQIYYNGVLLVRTTDYTTSGGTNTVTLLQGASAGDTVEIISSTPINLINTVTTNSANTITASTASSIPLKIVGAPSQSADLFEVLNSSNAELFAIRSNGRVKSSIISTEVDSTILGLHANANNSSSGTSVILWGKDIATWGGDVHYLADSRGVAGGHRFWNWDGTSFLQRAVFDKTGKLGIGTEPTYPIDLSYANTAGGINETGLRIRNTATSNSTQINLSGLRSWSMQVEGSFGAPAGGFNLVDNTAAASRLNIDSTGVATFSTAIRTNLIYSGRNQTHTSGAGYLNIGGSGFVVIHGFIGGNEFWDVIIGQFYGSINVISSAIIGSPPTRTYAMNQSGGLGLSMSGGTAGTYTINTHQMN